MWCFDTNLTVLLSDQSLFLKDNSVAPVILTLEQDIEKLERWPAAKSIYRFQQKFFEYIQSANQGDHIKLSVLAPIEDSIPMK